MNKDFWNDIVKIWCRTFDPEENKIVIEQAKIITDELVARKHHYTRNPLDDDEEE